MDILILQVFVSLLLVVSSVILFGFTCRQRSFEHIDRLALLPIEEDPPRPVPASPRAPCPVVKGNEGNAS